MYLDVIIDTIREIVRERGDTPAEFSPETLVVECGLDSLDIAALVARLEERIGIDPFADETLAQFPQTLKEMSELYARYA